MTLRLFDRDTVVRILGAAGCSYVKTQNGLYEVWEGPDGASFTLVLEPFDVYDEMTIRGVFEFTLRLPLPPELS